MSRALDTRLAEFMLTERVMPLLFSAPTAIKPATSTKTTPRGVLPADKIRRLLPRPART
jgi:hypothetical protein